MNDHRWRLEDIGAEQLTEQYMADFKSKMAAKDYDKASKILEKLMRIGKTNYDYLYLYARTKELAGHKAEAQDSYAFYRELACLTDGEKGKYCSLTRDQ